MPNQNTQNISETVVQLADALRQLADAQTAKNRIDLQVEDGQKTISRIEDRISFLNGKVGEIETIVTQKSNEISDYDKKITDLLEQIKTINADVVTAQTSADENTIHLKQENDTLVATLQNKISTIQTDVATARATYGDLKTQIINAQTELKNAQDSLASVKGQVVDANSILVTLKDQISNTQQTIVDLQTKSADLTGQVSSKTNTLTKLNTDIETAQNTLTLTKVNQTTTDELLASTKSDLANAQGGVKAINDRAFAITKREEDYRQKYAYIKGIYETAGVPFAEFSDQ